MKRINFNLFITMAMLMLSFNSAWAQYVKVTNGETVSWIEIEGTINGTNIEIYKSTWESAIDSNTKGSIDLNEVWSQNGGSGTHYQVTSIGNYAFINCTGLTSVVIPSSVTSIGENAFFGCSGLTSIEIPNSVTRIEKSAFYGCSGLISVTIGNSVTTIGQGAFADCTGLTSVGIPNSVTTIGNGAFSDCSSLTSVIIPSSVTNIEQYAFSGCNLIEVEIHTKGIGKWFSGIQSIQKITIGEEVTSIGYQAFQNCSGLTYVTIGKNVTNIEQYAFSGCILKEVEINAKTIGKWFNGIQSIQKIIIGEEVISIGREAFSGCSGLISIDIPNSVTNIGYQAFRGCSGLTSVTIGKNVTNIEQYAFSDCSGLKKVIVKDIAAWCNISFSDNPLSYAHHLYSDENTEITNLIIPSSVTSIANSAFEGCRSLTSVTFGNRVTSIGNYAFQGCSGLTSIDFPNRLTSIGKNAFQNCSDLTSLSIPISVTSIGNSAFYGCTKLESVYSEITNVFSIDAFEEGCDAILYVPYGTKLKYIQTSGWNVFNDIIEMDPAIMNTSLLLSCNSKGSITINGTTVFTNKIGGVDILEDAENTIVFTPKANCKLEQVSFNGFDITTSVENNTLKAVIPAKSQMVVTFTNEAGDMNNDGKIDISDVVVLVNMILGQ